MGSFEEISRLLERVETYKNHVLLTEKALEYAINEIGNGEEVSNNSGDYVVKYRYGVDDKGAWCASFVSWCFKEAAKELGIELPFEISSGAKRLYKNVGKVGSRSKDPRRGDIVCWDRGVDGSWQGHVGLVEKVTANGLVVTIEGNVGKFPAKVDRFVHDTRYERLVGYSRLIK